MYKNIRYKRETATNIKKNLINIFIDIKNK